MAWAKNGTPETLSGTDTSMDITDLSGLDFNMTMTHIFDAPYSATNLQQRFNSDTGSNYASRNSSNGGADATATSQTADQIIPTTVSNAEFIIQYIVGIDTEEKLVIGFLCDQNTAGAANAPGRSEHTGKWANTANSITGILQTQNGSDTFAANSNISALGTD